MNRNLPEVGQWYHHGDGQPFLVVAVDPAQARIELRYVDGTADTLACEHWDALAPSPIEAAPGAAHSDACNDCGSPGDTRYASFESADLIVDGDAALLAAELMPAPLRAA